MHRQCQLASRAARLSGVLCRQQVGFSGVDRVSVRDLIQHKAVGVHAVSMVVPPLPPHGVALYNVSIVWADGRQLGQQEL